MSEAVEARARAEAAQRAAADMLDSRQALAAENVELEEQVRALKNAQAHAQQQRSEWESRVAAAGEGGRKGEAKVRAELGRKDKEMGQLRQRVQELQETRERLLGRMKDMAAKKSGLSGTEIARLLASTTHSDANGMADAAAVDAAAPAASAVRQASVEVQTEAAQLDGKAQVQEALPAPELVAEGTQTSPMSTLPPVATVAAEPPVDTATGSADAVDRAPSAPALTPRANLLSEPPSAAIAEHAAATTRHAEQYAHLASLPDAARALMPRLAWTSGDAAGAIADTQAAVLDSIHSKLTELLQSRQQLQSELAAAQAELHTLRPANAQQRPSAAAGSGQDSGVVMTGANGAHEPREAMPNRANGHSGVALGATQADTPSQFAEQSEQSIGALPVQPTTPPAVPGTSGASAQQLSAQHAHDGAASVPQEAANAPLAGQLTGAGAVQDGRGAVSANATPAKPPAASVAAKSAPVTPAPQMAAMQVPSKRRGWFGGMFGGRRQPTPSPNAWLAA